MEKLIELLKEYDEYSGEKRRKYGWTKDKVELDVKMIIFKKYGFIKWLVDNDKIDRNKIYWLDIGYKIDEIGIGERKNTVDIDLSNKLLMLLAISDTPIDDLISYLK